MATADPARMPAPAESPARATGEVRWPPVLGLGALHGAVTLAWVVYTAYLGRVLVQAGFPATMTGALLVAEGLLAALVEPVVGALSDRARRGLFRRSVLVLGGTVLAGTLLVTVALAARGARPGWASLVPALLVAWSVAMALFRSPALSLLARHARPGALPLAAAVLTALGGAVGLLAPVARAWLLSLGAATTFAAASLALVATALVVRRLEAGSAAAGATPPEDAAPEAPLQLGLAVRLFAVGLAAALAYRLRLGALDRLEGGTGAAVFLGVVALLAVPAGVLALRTGGASVTRLAAGGLAILSVSLALVPGGAVRLVLAGLVGAVWAALQNGLFAWSLSAGSLARAGAGLGLLLGGAGLALGVFTAVMGVRPPAPPNALWTAAGLDVVTLGLLVLRRSPPSRGRTAQP